MARFKLESKQLLVEVDSFGAELKSIKKKNDGTEYMWNANPMFWKRTSPVLFPLVGALKDGKYTYAGNAYEMSQHGFARDKEFELVKKDTNFLEFVLKADEDTMKIYPFLFELRIAYCLEGTQLKVQWTVRNLDEKMIYFSIGGHPAFMCPIVEGTQQTDYTLKIGTNSDIVSSVIGEGGVLNGTQKKYMLVDGVLPITEDLFDDDALVIENSQAKKVSLCYNGNAYLTVRFDAPVFGIWSPPKKNAPFVCIEPWYGRCDAVGFSGNLEQREWGNALQVGEEFHAEYEIEIH